LEKNSHPPRHQASLKTKGLGIILTPWATFVPISTFLLFLNSEVACGEEFARFWQFLKANFATIKSFPKI